MRWDKATPTLTGDDAVRFEKALNNPQPIPKWKQDRARKTYKSVMQSVHKQTTLTRSDIERLLWERIRLDQRRERIQNRIRKLTKKRNDINRDIRAFDVVLEERHRQKLLPKP